MTRIRANLPEVRAKWSLKPPPSLLALCYQPTARGQGQMVVEASTFAVGFVLSPSTFAVGWSKLTAYPSSIMMSSL